MLKIVAVTNFGTLPIIRIRARRSHQRGEHVDPKVKNLDYLIQKLPFDFFEFLNPSKNLYRNFIYLREEHLSILDELAQGFLDLVDKQFD